MRRTAGDLAARVDSIRARAVALTSVRSLVALPRARDLSAAQWGAIEPRLAATAQGLVDRARRLADRALAGADDPSVARALASSLGELELELGRAYGVMDTFVDVLTQRASPTLGPLLAGCDVLAADALDRPAPALRSLVRPIVHCDRGLGASVLREGARMPDGRESPVALVQIPLSRLADKLSLVSLLHEVGHQALHRLRLVEPLAELLGRAVSSAGARSAVAELFARWSFELGPDAWAFGNAGIAQPYALRDVLSLPAPSVVRISPADSHPTPLVRVHLAFELARVTFGGGAWDDARRAWAALYPTSLATAASRALLEECLRFVPVAARALHEGRLESLRGRPLLALFDRRAIDPELALDIARGARRGRLALFRLRPAAHLAVFRWLHEKRWLDGPALERTMTRWLVALGARARTTT